MLKSNVSYTDLLARAFYYRVWALLQRNDIAFFTYKEDVQNICVLFGMISLVHGFLGAILNDRQVESKK